MAKRRRLSTPTRIFLGFALVLTTFGGVAVMSLLENDRTAATLGILHEGYLPLALTVGEVRANQNIFLNTLDGVLREIDPTATRNWLNFARRFRPVTLNRSLEGIERVRRLQISEGDRAVLNVIEREMNAVRQSYARDDTKYDQLFAALEKHNAEEAARVLNQLKVTEHEVRSHLRVAWDALQERIQGLARSSTEQQRQSAVLLAVLTVVALGIGVAVVWWSQRVLSPLTRLQQRVAAVARGDLASRPLQEAVEDEFSRVAQEFERMVQALRARDERLREAAEAQRRSERLAAIGTMAAHVTHEVRNPLSSIGLNVEMLAEELGSADGDVQALISAVQKEVDRLTAITEEYLELGRLPTPKLEPDDLGVIAQSVASFVRREMEASGVELHVHVEKPLPRVSLDERQVRQALLNLLRNAHEAMPEGGTATLEAVRAEGGVLIRIRDEGPGIPEDQRDRIFDLFYTTKERGTGLGLPLTQQIMLAHGGTIECKGVFGGGACFELWFPVADESEPAQEDENDAQGRSQLGHAEGSGDPPRDAAQP